MTDELDKIYCQCGRWVMRYEKGHVYTVCPRCGGDVGLDIDWLLARVAAEIEGLQSEYAKLLKMKQQSVSTKGGRGPHRPKLIS